MTKKNDTEKRDDAKAQKRAEALRQNLLKRKQQTRARNTTEQDKEK